MYELFAAVVVNLIATVLKFGDRTQIGAVHLATSLVADLQLIAAALAWGYAAQISSAGLDAAGDGQRGVAVRRRAAGQPRLGRAAGDRDRVVPAPVSGRASWPIGCCTAWWRLARGDERPAGIGRGGGSPPASAVQASATIFLILRRMRAPLIVLIVIFAVSVLGLTLIPGRDADGQPTRMGFFDAFYFMSYTATTIGYGEIPHPFTDAQRLWVMVTIYLTVIGWAYAIGSLLTLLQDRAFRQALALQRFTRTVARLREPFLLIVGYGQTGQLLGRSLDALGRRFVVIDVVRGPGRRA